MKHITKTFEGPGKHLKEYRQGGISAGHKAVADMFKRIAADGVGIVPAWMAGAGRAAQDACEQMRQAGSTEEQIEAWAQGFSETLNAHEAQFNKVAKLVPQMEKKAPQGNAAGRVIRDRSDRMLMLARTAMIRVNRPFGGAAAGITTFRGFSANTTNGQNTYSFTSIDIGAASANRMVVAILSLPDSTPMTNPPDVATFGGVSGDLVGSKQSGTARMYGHIACVPTGTTMTAAYTLGSSGEANTAHLGVWTFNAPGITSPGSLTHFEFGPGGSSGTTTGSVGLGPTGGGFAPAFDLCGMCSTSVTSDIASTVTYDGVSLGAPTEVFAEMNSSAITKAFASLQADADIEWTWASSGDVCAMAFITDGT